MKKKVLLTVFIAAVAIYTGYRATHVQKIDLVSDLLLENIDALADNPEVEIAFCIDSWLICVGQGIEDIDGYRQY